MTKIRGLFFLACLVCGGGAVVAADFDAGMEAYKSGDYATAREKWRPLAEQGMVEAQFNLGLLLKNGQGAPPDPVEAARWFLAAAEQGFRKAQFNLAELYEQGIGVEADRIQAYRWFKLAEDGKVPGARKRRKSTAKQMTPKEIALGDLEYREWKRKRKEQS
jgi:hypothetical protein